MAIRHSGIIRRVLLLVCTVGALVCSGPTSGQESASYVMDRVTFSSAALEASSTNFDAHLTLGQEGPVGSVSVCNAGAFQSTGFWSILGETPVPIVLSARQDSVDPSAVELAWSGSVGLFEVFSTDVAATVSDPVSSLTVTSLCSLTDVPPPDDVTYYLVLPAGD